MLSCSPPREKAWSKWGRRMVLIPLFVFGGLLMLAMAPLLVPLAVAVDLLRGKTMLPALRTLCFVAFGFFWEIVGLSAATLVWLLFGPWRRVSQERFLAWNYRVQFAWGKGYTRIGRWLFNVSEHVECDYRFGNRPVIVFMRHASSVDTTIPVNFISAPHGMRLRYVLKRELLWAPCIDIVGNRLPNYFVARDSGDSDEEIEHVGQLAHDLKPREGVLIYPEGTRFTEERRAHVIARLKEKGSAELAQRAERWAHVLPPKIGGPLALLRENSGADAVFCAHTGFEGSATLGSLLKGEVIGKTIYIRIWAIPFDDIPQSEDERVEWLFAQWQRVNDFVGENK